MKKINISSYIQLWTSMLPLDQYYIIVCALNKQWCHYFPSEVSLVEFYQYITSMDDKVEVTQGIPIFDRYIESTILDLFVKHPLQNLYKHHMPEKFIVSGVLKDI